MTQCHGCGRPVLSGWDISSNRTRFLNPSTPVYSPIETRDRDGRPTMTLVRNELAMAEHNCPKGKHGKA